jgi:sugar/nucleoside kinase (ribokinase family)
MLDVVVGSRTNSWEWVRPVLPETDYFLPNHDEAREIAGGDDVLAQARRLRDAGCRHVVITCGGAGAVSVGPEGAWRAAVYQVPTVDPTGTGDAFVAGYVLGLLQQQSPAACLTLGSAMGAYCVQGVGATTNIPNQAELERFVRKHELSVNRLAIPVS